MEKKKWIIIVVAIIVGLAAIYFSLLFYRSCDNKGCFDKNLISCAKTKFIQNSGDVIWLYTIKGKQSGSCVVNAEILSIKEGKASLSYLEGKSMDCYIPLKLIAVPEADISKCHGLLKEALQDETIKNMHAYILENLGQIKEEFDKIV